MKLVLKKNQTIKWPVTVKQAIDGGKTEEVQLSATFNVIPESEYNAIFDKHAGDFKGDHAVLNRVVEQIEGLGLEDDDGKEQAFNKAAHMDMVLDHPNMRAGLMTAYIEVRFGRLEKNV